MKTLNIIFPEKEKIELREETVPAMGVDEVLCAADKSLVSTGTETRCLLGIFDRETNWSDWVKYPFHPGYSMVGKVLEVGAGVTAYQRGDRVWANGIPHNQFFTVKTADVLKLPAAISAEDGAWSNLACTTQLGVRRAELKLGESVGVVGLGILGQLVVQYLKVNGARKVIAIDTMPQRLELAKIHGATHVLAMDAKSARSHVEKITAGKMLDVVLDVTGHPAVLAPATQLLRKLGRLVLLGDTTTPSLQPIGPRVLSNSISILGIHASMFPAQYSEFNPWSAGEMAGLFYDYLTDKRMAVVDLITHRLSPQDAPQVYADLVKDRSKHMGVIFDWTRL